MKGLTNTRFLSFRDIIIFNIIQFLTGDEMELNDAFEFESQIQTKIDQNHLFIFMTNKKFISISNKM